jgi:histidinol-phosphate phosphatase family protein
MELSSVTVAVLAGGLGTRLRSAVADRPKVLAEIRARPFLSYLLDQLAAASCRSVVLCTGYLGEQIESTFGKNYGPLRIFYSREQEPLGTAGALRLATPHFDSDSVLVMNGDSFCDINLETFWDWHCARQAQASIALTQVAGSERFGSVKVDPNGKIIEFAEKKQTDGSTWINAGIYFLNRDVLRAIPEGANVSLEREVFPRWVGRGLYGYASSGLFLDIGTPEDFAAAGNFFANLSTPHQRRFVVLDRDGTIIEECEYLSEPDQIVLIPGAATALRELQQMGFGLIITTNQSGVGRGLFDLAQVERVHERLERSLASEGVRLDGFYVCPHHPDDQCGCRKPKLGLLEKAASDLGFSLAESIVIGDKSCDVDMGRAAGAMTLLVRSGYGAQFENTTTADYVVDDLPAATELIRCLVGRGRTVSHGH